MSCFVTGVVCFAPLNGMVVLSCPNEDGKWLHNSTILDNVTSSNLTLTGVQYNNSGIYLHDSKDQCEYRVSVGGTYRVCTDQCVFICAISS